MSNNINRLIGCLTLMMAFATGTYAQQLKGHVYASDNEPVADAVITSPGCKTVRSAEDGTFVMEGVAKGNPLTVWHDGFFQKVVYVNEPAAADLKIYMVEENKSRYNETMLTPFDTKQGAQDWLFHNPALCAIISVNDSALTEGMVCDACGGIHSRSSVLPKEPEGSSYPGKFRKEALPDEHLYGLISLFYLSGCRI